MSIRSWQDVGGVDAEAGYVDVDVDVRRSEFFGSLKEAFVEDVSVSRWS